MMPDGTLESIADLLNALRAVPYRPSAGRGHADVGNLVQNLEVWWDNFGELVPGSPEYDAKYPPQDQEGHGKFKKVTKTMAQKIRMWRDQGMSVATLARRYGVTERAVKKVLDRQIWK